MRKLLAMTAGVALVGATASSQPVSDEARETALWEIAKERRLDAFAAHLDSDFVAVYSDGFKDKAAEVAAIGDQKLTSFAISNFRSRSIDPDVSLVTYTVDAQGSYRDVDISGRYNVASLWRRAGDGWTLAYHSEVKAS